jgi:hypothetical protein
MPNLPTSDYVQIRRIYGHGNVADNCSASLGHHDIKQYQFDCMACISLASVE